MKNNRSDRPLSPVRDLGFDNLRGFLILCVVAGHILESCGSFPGHRILYQLIYSFHMPAFIFVTGYFARSDLKKLLSFWVIPYFVFQSLYLGGLILTGSNTIIQYSVPYWHLWFLLACIFYQLLIPLYTAVPPARRWLALSCVTVLALLAGFDRSMSYELSLSRFFVFQPWFLLGLYFHQYIAEGHSFPPSKHKGAVWAILSAAVCVAVVAVIVLRFSDTFFYGSFPYSEQGGSVIHRAAIMVIALIWICLFVCLTPLLRRKLPLLTTLGQNTLPVFLLHPAMINGLKFVLSQKQFSPGLALLYLAVILAVLGNPLTGRLMRWVFTFKKS